MKNTIRRTYTRCKNSFIPSAQLLPKNNLESLWIDKSSSDDSNFRPYFLPISATTANALDTLENVYWIPKSESSKEMDQALPRIMRKMNENNKVQTMMKFVTINKTKRKVMYCKEHVDVGSCETNSDYDYNDFGSEDELTPIPEEPEYAEIERSYLNNSEIAIEHIYDIADSWVST